MWEDSNGGRQSYIEFLKGLSILLIVIFHIDLCYIVSPRFFLSKLTFHFSFATRVFFFCSGFGLYYSLVQNPLRWTDFIRKRYLKVYLPYILIVFVCALVPYTYAYEDRFSALMSHVFLYKMFIPKYVNSFGPFWYMSTIFEFYLFFYLIVRMKNKMNNNRLFLIIWIVINLVWGTLAWLFPKFEGFFWNEYGNLYATFFFFHGWIFALGMLIAEMLYQNKKVFVSFSHLVIGIVVMALFYRLMSDDMIYLKEIPRAVLFMCFFTAAWVVCGDTIRRFIVWLGSFSFEWYLTHMLILEGLYRLIKPVGIAKEVVFTGMGIVITAFAAWLYHQFVKKVLFHKIRM